MRSAAKVVELRQPSFSGKMPRKPRNKDVRTREYLTPDEVDQLMKTAARVGRHPHRDRALILISFRHGLRVSELVSLQWSQVDLKGGQIHVSRLKGEITLQSCGEHPASPVPREAEACFEKALEIAKEQSAKSWELRAATSLARLWQQQGKTVEAHQLLSEIYNWFTEGFDTKDLQEAKALLEELG
jgi:integrase